MLRLPVRTIVVTASVAALAALAALPLSAQDSRVQETKAANAVPSSAQPPAGLCRVWLENVPASLQPAPTDCATAIRNRPNNAKLLFGDLRDSAAKTRSKGSGVTSSASTSVSPPFGTSRRMRSVNAAAGPPGRNPTTDSGPKRRP